jgi:hypothetical protein
MTTRSDTRRLVLIRLLAVLGLGWGTAHLARPGSLVDAVCPEYPRSRVWVVRVLGARLLLQHAAVLAAPGTRLVGAASGVDLLHAASMVPLLRLPRYRRAALVSGGVAALSAAVFPAVVPRPVGK